MAGEPSEQQRSTAAVVSTAVNCRRVSFPALSARHHGKLKKPVINTISYMDTASSEIPPQQLQRYEEEKLYWRRLNSHRKSEYAKSSWARITHYSLTSLTIVAGTMHISQNSIG